MLHLILFLLPDFHFAPPQPDVSLPSLWFLFQFSISCLAVNVGVVFVHGWTDVVFDDDDDDDA